LTLRPDVITEEQERELLREFETLRFDPIVIRGQAARRTARHYGLSYDYEARSPLPGEPIPAWLGPARDAAARLADVSADELVEALIQRYPAGSTIGWHRDAPAFGIVVGLSLLGSARLRFQRGPRGQANLGGSAAASLRLRSRRRSAPVLGTLDPGDEGTALLGHIPHAAAQEHDLKRVGRPQLSKEVARASSSQRASSSRS
jgi:hypothetical protein